MDTSLLRYAEPLLPYDAEFVGSSVIHYYNLLTNLYIETLEFSTRVGTIVDID